MRSYVFRNLALFVSVVVASIVLIGIIQFLSIDREMISRQRKDLEEINSKFKETSTAVIQSKFTLIEFLSNTSYPAVAIAFNTHQQFNAKIDQLDSGPDNLGVLLFDRDGNLISERNVGPELKNAILKEGVGHYVGGDFRFGTNYVAYTKEVSATGLGEATGYLMGIQSTQSITGALNATYHEATLNFSHFNPRINFNFPISPSEDLKIDFSYASPTSSFFKAFDKSFLQVFLVAGIILVIFTYLLRKSLKKPVEELLRIVTHVSQSRDQSYGGNLPTDKVFKEIGVALLEMHRHRSNLEKEKRKKEISESLADIALKVAHDIRSPLSSLETATRFFGKVQSPEGAFQDHLNLLQLSSRRLRSIADDLLMSHDNQSRSSKSVFSLHHVLDELIGEYTSQGPGKDLTFKKEYDEAIPCVGYRDRIQRAFGNIIKNAVEAIDKEGVIALKTWTQDGYGIISITDTGCGMTQAKLTEVLKGGFTDGKADGHGIGMAVVRETIEEHGGVMEAESGVGKGTIFRIKLPLPNSIEMRSAPIVDQWSGSFELELQKNEAVIIIDDEPSMRFQWELLLKEKGFSVLAYASFEEFDGNFSPREKFQSAIVDYHFNNSKFDGLEVIKKLKSRGMVNLYLCTAEYWKPMIQEQAKDLGILICPKPISKIVIRTKEPEKHGPKTEGYKVLVIDDDELIGLTWKSLKDQLKIGELHYFPTLEKFMESRLDASKFDIAFVDKNIEGSKYPGEQVMGYLREHKLARVVQSSGESGLKIPESIEAFLQ